MTERARWRLSASRKPCVAISDTNSSNVELGKGEAPEGRRTAHRASIVYWPITKVLVQAVWWRVYPWLPVHKPRAACVSAGFSPLVDERRLLSIRGKVARGQHFITLHDARFLLTLIDRSAQGD